MKNTTSFRISEGLQEGVHYTLFEDGNGTFYPVAIALHEAFMPRKSGIVQIESFRVAQNEARNDMEGRDDLETRGIFRNVKDKATGLWFGRPIGISPTDKQIMWQRIPLRMRQPFDFSNINDREEWSMVSRMSNLEGSPNQAGKPLYKIIDKDLKALNYLKIFEKREEARDVVKSLDEQQRRDIAIDCGINADAYSMTMLKSELIKFADEHAERFMSIWHNPNRANVNIFNKARKYGVITFDAVGRDGGHGIGFYYNNLFIGDVEAAVVAKLSEPGFASSLATIAILTANKEKDILNGTAMKEVVKDNFKTVEVVKKDPKDEQIATMAKELEEMKALMAKSFERNPVNKNNLTKEEPLKVSEQVSVSTEKTVIHDPEGELRILRAEAKELKVKSWQVLGVDKLKLAIAEKKQVTA